MSRPANLTELAALADALVARYHAPEALAFVVEVTGRPLDGKLTTDDVGAVFARLDAREAEDLAEALCLLNKQVAVSEMPADPARDALVAHLASLAAFDLPAFLAPSRPRHQRTEGRPGLSSTPCCRAVRCSRGP